MLNFKVLVTCFDMPMAIVASLHHLQLFITVKLISHGSFDKKKFINYDASQPISCMTLFSCSGCILLLSHVLSHHHLPKPTPLKFPLKVVIYLG